MCTHVNEFQLELLKYEYSKPHVIIWKLLLNQILKYIVFTRKILILHIIKLIIVILNIEFKNPSLVLEVFCDFGGLQHDMYKIKSYSSGNVVAIQLYVEYNCNYPD